MSNRVLFLEMGTNMYLGRRVFKYIFYKIPEFKKHTIHMEIYIFNSNKILKKNLF